MHARLRGRNALPPSRHAIAPSNATLVDRRTRAALAPLASVDSSLCQDSLSLDHAASAPPGPGALPPDVIAAFLQQQRGSSEGDDGDSDAEGGGGSGALAPRGASGKSQRAARAPRRTLPRWLQRLLVMAAHTGLLAGGVALGRAIHANYMVRPRPHRMCVLRGGAPQGAVLLCYLYAGT